MIPSPPRRTGSVMRSLSTSSNATWPVRDGENLYDRILNCLEEVFDVCDGPSQVGPFAS